MAEPGKSRARPARIGAPSQNRSLQRGLDILKMFRPGLDLLGNSEIAEKTGIAKATVSRLTQTLVNSGLLDYDPRARAYRLGATLLSLALAARLSNPVLQIALPLMRAASDDLHVNVGLATADQDEMVYLESIRYSSGDALRTIVSGQRVPIELTSLGRAYLAAMPEEQRSIFLERLRTRRPRRWEVLEHQIVSAIDSVGMRGYCAASWQPGAVALATPISLPRQPIYVLNMSLTTAESQELVIERLREPLLAVRSAVAEAFDQLLATKFEDL